MFVSAQYIQGINFWNGGMVQNTTEVLQSLSDSRAADFTNLTDPVSVTKRDFDELAAVMENPDLFEGDILLAPLMGRNAIRNEARKWPQARVPYEISFPYGLLGVVYVLVAMSQIHLNTCVRFVPRTNETDYIQLTRGKGCSSFVGRVGGAQEVVLQEGGCDQLGVVMHELIHALGFWHEQSRFDRDAHVIIHWTNIKPGMWFNFGKGTPIHQQTLDEEYDFGSLMHYGPRAFAIDQNRPTISALKPTAASRRMGQRTGMSAIDVRKINKLYKC